nr:SDR family NAD(P)-dependent oxidoreductase [Pseudomonas sp. NFACC46-3]
MYLSAGRNAGRIINIGSILGVVPVPYAALYSASKHAVEGYSQALDPELRTHGIRGTVVEPGYTKTRFESNTLQPHARLDVYEDVRVKVTKVVSQAMAPAHLLDTGIRRALQLETRWPAQAR